MDEKARPNRAPMTLRAMRRDLAVLTGAAAISIGLSSWIHAQACALEVEPKAGVTVAEAAPRPSVGQTPNTPTPLLYGEHFAFVVDLEEPYLVLATNVEASWEGELEGLLGVDTVFRGVDRAALPKSLRTMEGREVTLWTTEVEGRAVALGTARIGAPRLVAQAAGALGPDAKLDTWSLHERLERDGVLPANLESEAKDAIWDDGLRLLVAPLEGPRASEATWARAADLSAPEFFSPVELDAGHEGALHRAFFAHPEGEAAAELHVIQGYGSVAPYVLAQGWAGSDGELRLATAFVDSPHVDVCGGYDGSFALATRVRGDDWDSAARVPTHHTTGPALVGDFNADGYPDMLLEPRPLDGDSTLLRGTAEGFERIETLGEVPYFGCRC